MNKTLFKLIRFIMIVIYFPVLYFIIRSGMKERENILKGNKITLVEDLDYINTLFLCPFVEIKTYRVGEYTICIFPKYSLLLLGVVVVTTSKYILVGCEAAEEFLNNTAMAAAVVGHEQGHINHPEGQSSARLWWNPEDWVITGSVYTPAEVAADRWALEHGASGEALIEFLKKFIRLKPLTMFIRIGHIKWYMLWHKNE